MWLVARKNKEKVYPGQEDMFNVLNITLINVQNIFLTINFR